MKNHPMIKSVRFIPACQHNSPTEGRCTADEVTNHYCQKHHEEAEARVEAFRKLRLFGDGTRRAAESGDFINGKIA